MKKTPDKKQAKEFLVSKFTLKQIEIVKRYRHKDFFIMILHGAVRSGKTKINNFLFIQELRRVKRVAEKKGIKKPMYILAAYSSSTLQTNILDPIEEDYGYKFKFDKHNNFEMLGVKVVTTFTSSISGLGAIRGMESYGAYINEATLGKKEVFDEIIKRCSGEGARLLVDTNPDHPEHWLKRNYIDKADGEDIVEFNFKLTDNNFLDARYVSNLKKATPSGAFYERGINGLWTIGEGAIYADFDQAKHVISPEDTPEMERYIVGVDWGYRHYGVMAVIGIDFNGAYYLIEENAHQELHISDWLDIADRIRANYGDSVPFYCDTARTEYIDALYLSGANALNGDKAVLSGITEVAKQIKSDNFFALSTNKVFLKQINAYVWNRTGDAPLKEDDDVADAIRYAIYTDKNAQENRIIA